MHDINLFLGKVARYHRPSETKSGRTPSETDESQPETAGVTGSPTVEEKRTLERSGEDTRRTSRREQAPWRKRETSSPPIERIPSEDDVPWRKRSQSEDRRAKPRAAPEPVRQQEPAWKQGVRLLKKPQEVKLAAPQAQTAPWKAGVEMLRKSSPTRKPSVVDTVPPLTAKTAQVPWKSGAQMLKKVSSREPSPARTEEANTEEVPWKTFKLRKASSRDASPEKRSEPVEWKDGVKMLRKSPSRDVSPEVSRDSRDSRESRDAVEWKDGVKMLRKRSVTPVRLQDSHEAVVKKESAKKIVAGKLASVVKQLKDAPQAPEASVIPDVKPKPPKREVTAIDLKKVPGKTKEDAPALKPVPRKKEEVLEKPKVPEVVLNRPPAKSKTDESREADKSPVVPVKPVELPEEPKPLPQSILKKESPTSVPIETKSDVSETGAVPEVKEAPWRKKKPDVPVTSSTAEEAVRKHGQVTEEPVPQLVLKKTPQKPKTDEPEGPGSKLKKSPRKPKENLESQQITLKPIPKKTDSEPELKPETAFKATPHKSKHGEPKEERLDMKETKESHKIKREGTKVELEATVAPHHSSPVKEESPSTKSALDVPIKPAEGQERKDLQALQIAGKVAVEAKQEVPWRRKTTAPTVAETLVTKETQQTASQSALAQETEPEERAEKPGPRTKPTSVERISSSKPDEVTVTKHLETISQTKVIHHF